MSAPSRPPRVTDEHAQALQIQGFELDPDQTLMRSTAPTAGERLAVLSDQRLRRWPPPWRTELAPVSVH